jgi:hypothetical protein
VSSHELRNLRRKVQRREEVREEVRRLQDLLDENAARLQELRERHATVGQLDPVTEEFLQRCDRSDTNQALLRAGVFLTVLVFVGAVLVTALP